MNDDKLYDSSRLVEGEIEYLKLLEERINSKTTREDIIGLLAVGEKLSKSSFILHVEWNLKGLFELQQGMCSSLVPVKEYQDKRRDEILDIITNSIKSLLREKFEHPKRIYEQKIFRIEYEGRLIDVEEICRKNYDFILYKSTSYPCEYFIDAYYEYRRSSSIIKIEESDAVLIPTLGLDEITELIKKYK